LQSVSAALAAAIEAPERYPVARLLVDWHRDGNWSTTYTTTGVVPISGGGGGEDTYPSNTYEGDTYTGPAGVAGGVGSVVLTLPLDDLSGDIVSVDLSRELTTDLPPQTKLFSGAAAAEATITLAHQPPLGAPHQHTAWFYSPLNNASPLFGVRRKGAPARLELGFVGANGPEYVRVLTGRVRSLQVTSGGRQAVMRISDFSEDMRRQVTLPMIIADGDLPGATVLRPGLNTTFLADWVARKCGYYASPPPRSGCRVSVTNHGSGYPEVGVVREHHGAAGSKLSYSPTPTFPGTAKWVQAVNTNGATSQALRYTMASTVSVNNGGEILWEGWRKFNSTSVNQPLMQIYSSQSATAFVSAYWQSASGKFQVTFNRSGADATNRSTGLNGPTVSPGTGWNYWAVQCSFLSTGVEVTFRFNGATTGPITVSTASVTGVEAMDRFDIAEGRVDGYNNANLNGLSEADQVTNESTTSLWNDAFAPTAQIIPSSAIDNRLVATPAASEEGWDLFQQIAESEFATAGFTEAGMLFYWSRRRWTTAPYTTSQRTLTAANSLKEVETVEAIDQVRNRIILRARTPVVEDQQTVWKAASRWIIPANSSTVKIASLNDPVGNVDTTMVYGTALGSSRYLAADQLDGQGSQVSNLTWTITPLSPTAIRVQAFNPNNFTVYAVGDENASSTFSGKAYIWVDAQKVLFSENNGVRVEAFSATSISSYGEQLLELESNDFRQDDDDLQQIADDLRTDLADPGPTLSEVPVVADPRLQLGDRVTISDPDGLGFTSDFHISRIDTNLDADGGLSQSLGLRKA
jgi:hypothetical protein